jgi:DNA repair protein RadC
LITLLKGEAPIGILNFPTANSRLNFIEGSDIAFHLLKNRAKYNSSEKSHTIHDLPQSERPRERLHSKGADKLSDSELLAIILRTGLKGESVILLAQKLISRFGSIGGLMNASVDDLKKVKGIGTAKAVALSACLEIARRINSRSSGEIADHLKKAAITEPENASGLFREYFTDFMKEQFMIASFDTRSRLLGVDVVSTGTLTASLVHPREVYISAIRRHAVCIIAAHNHPSGDTEPSDEDIRTTKRLSEAGKIMGIQLIDHLIITKNNYFSFKEAGRL